MTQKATKIEAAKELMTEVFQEVGKQFEYENVTTDFVAFKQFKVQWQRSYNWISFKISDYMMDAPREVMYDLAQSIFSKIKGNPNAGYNGAMTAWVLAPEFSQTHRQTFIRRGRYLTSDGYGEHKNLNDSITRLVEAGLIPQDHNILAVWNNDTRSEMAATYSVLMRTVMVHTQLDDADVSDNILDYVVYNQYLRIKEGVRTFGTDDATSTRDDEKKFPEYGKVEEALDRMTLVL